MIGMAKASFKINYVAVLHFDIHKTIAYVAE